MKNNIFIIIYPYKFTDFLWSLLELDELSKFTEVQVWDISKIINLDFANNIAANSSCRKEIINIESILAFISHIHAFIKQNKKNNICILNEVTKISPIGLLVELILYFYLKSTDAKVFDLFNGGVPLLYPNDIVKNNSRHVVFRIYFKIKRLISDSTNNKEMVLRIISHVSSGIGEKIPSCLTHRLVAGNSWHAYALKNFKIGAKLVSGHSHDYSNYLTSIKLLPNQLHKRYLSAVLLDGAGPLFNSDSSLSKRKVFFTSDVWYPELMKFFDYLEERTKVIVEVAGHYKSNHISPAPCFGNRNVRYSSTREMVHHSEYVITRCSTAISYAVLYRKPILFIYSTQLSFDVQAMDNINGMAEVLGTTPINIDNFPKDIERYLRVDETKYSSYESEVLTSYPLGRPNFQIILEDIMGITTQLVK